ncbi:MRPL49 54S ribosomal protein L49 [Candida maltosa Xu316]
MFRSVAGYIKPSVLRNSIATYSTGTASTITPSSLSTLKLSSNGSRDLYAIFKLHNLPYLVTKGDKIYLPYKLKGAAVGDVLNLNNVTTLGSPNYTLHSKDGISQEFFKLTAGVTEITKEPKYEYIKKQPRCRRKKTVRVEPFQTVLTINELKLK